MNGYQLANLFDYDTLVTQIHSGGKHGTSIRHTLRLSETYEQNQAMIVVYQFAEVAVLLSHFKHLSQPDRHVD